jgi:hypothetical protein
VQAVRDSSGDEDVGSHASSELNKHGHVRPKLVQQPRSPDLPMSRRRGRFAVSRSAFTRAIQGTEGKDKGAGKTHRRVRLCIEETKLDLRADRCTERSDPGEVYVSHCVQANAVRCADVHGIMTIRDRDRLGWTDNGDVADRVTETMRLTAER